MKAVAFLLPILLTACANVGGTQQGTGARLPPELQRVLDDYSAAWRARDAKGLANLFADDRMVVPNACAPSPNRAGIEACYTGSGGAIDLRALEYRIDGPAAYIIGEYSDAPGAPAAGKYVLTLTRGADGRWLIVADMDQPYRRRPATPAPTP